MIDEQNLTKTNINWYPGHMAKAKKQIIEALNLIDVVVELLDARIPISSKNPDIEQITRNKKKIIVLNKSDLSDEKQNIKWVSYFKQQAIRSCLCESHTGKGINQAVKQIEEIMEKDLQNLMNKGRIGKKIRVMVLGITNVGKSSFINRIAKKSIAEVANKPGVTKSKQWIRINNNIELLDTPGVLWPKFETKQIALNLAYTGTIKSEVLDNIQISINLIILLYKEYLDFLLERYKLERNDILDIINEKTISDEKKAYYIIDIIGRKRGAILTKNEINYDRTCNIILDDFRNGKIGRITLEKRE